MPQLSCSLQNDKAMNRLLAIVLIALGVVQSFAQPSALDYSYVGYHMCEKAIPDVPAIVSVPCRSGDMYGEIQHAIDHVSAMKTDKKTGMRGAVVLSEGVYEISEPLRIGVSGVVLRGSGHKATVLRKTGVDRGAIVYIEGKDNRIITSSGEDVLITRKSTKEWINSLGCSSFVRNKELAYWGWHPGEIDLEFTRISKNGSYDAPLPFTLDADCKVEHYVWSGRVHDSGVENLQLEAAHISETDEDHAWNGVYIANAKDCWVRVVDFRYLTGSAVVIQRSGSQITVEDCRSLHPVGELGGMRRRSFLTFGERCLFQRIYSEEGINDFSTGMLAVGPNVFSQCDTYNSHGFSGSTGSWASGILFDVVNIDGGDIKFCNLGLEKYGQGWNATNSTAYQCSAAGIFADSIPDGSKNYAIGCWAQFHGNGYFENCNNHVKPWSLFHEQLAKRLGNEELANRITRTYIRPTRESTSPTIEQAMQFTKESHIPRITMKEWADSARIPSSGKGRILVYKAPAPVVNAKKYAIENGKIKIDGILAVGHRHDAPWWNSRVRYDKMARAQDALTRFVPGMEFRGATDRIDTVVSDMVKAHKLMLHQNYGLWYDRRRDDHERVRRSNSDVWGPFYEQAIARSGQGKAWDGLSKYDLTRLNPYYFYRLNEFAKKGASKGLLLFNDMYFQHNIIEAGAHWVDSPWRTANNINYDGFPEPVPFASDKRIFMADYFYNVKDEKLAQIHRDFIRKELEALKNNPNVIHSIGEEFTGPFEFVKFWLETVSQWEQETGCHPMVALVVNKDVQDSVLADPQLSRVVDIIGIQQWWNHEGGIYAPPGGVNMAPRQYLRKIRVGKTMFTDVYHAVYEYRKAYPDKAVIYSAKNYPEYAWAALMAGGSCAPIPYVNDEFLADVATMAPSGAMGGVYMMENPDKGAVVYIDSDSKEASIDIPAGKYRVMKINGKSGDLSTVKTSETISGSYKLTGGGIFWLKKK